MPRIALSKISGCLFLCLTLLAAGCATTAAVRPGKDDFAVRRGKIFRGSKDWTLRVVHVPGLCEKGGPVDMAAIARLADVGGNTLSMDLCGLSADGASLDPKAVETVALYAEECKDTWMGFMVRVLAGVPDDPAVRAKAVVTAAKALRGEGKAVYWIDGPDAAALAKKFKKAAPNLIVAAPGNADILTADAAPAKAGGQPVMVVDIRPEDIRPETHFVVTHSDAVYAALDKAFADPLETAPWTPDNSVLSEAERAEGFISLFDGKSLDGWWLRSPDVQSFEVKDGNIEWVRKGSDAMFTRDRYDNFILRFEWKIEKGGNNGVWLRAPRAVRSSKIGFEFQIMGDSDIAEPTADSTGSVYRVIPAKALAARPEGEWNEVEIMLNGPHYQATLNGVQIQDVNFDEHPELAWRLRKGFICISDHGSPAWFRNIRVKKL